MLVFRCTQKLQKRLKVRAPINLPKSSAQLGDWYGNTLFVGRLRLVIFISETTMLPVVVTLRESKTLVPRFQKALCQLLEALQMPKSIVLQEMDIDSGWAFGPTASRRVVGVLNELAYQAEAELYSGRCGNPLDLALRLSGVPIGGLEHIVPCDAARMLLAPTAPKRAIWQACNLTA
ncbi:MAG: hypothetical protein LAO51_08920 [Acidobacteriia bacterium]|nr:hypothetical protein [Terriglobia bacterium]